MFFAGILCPIFQGESKEIEGKDFIRFNATGTA